MGHNSVLKLGHSLLRSVVSHSTRGAKVVKKRIGKVFQNRALDRFVNRVLEKSTSLVMLDDGVASIVLEKNPKCPSQNPLHGKGDFRVDVATNKPLTISSPKRILSSSEQEEEDEEEENDEVYIKRVKSLDYSSFSEQEFKEMVESFIERFNHRITDEHYYCTHSHKNIVLAESP